VLEPPGPRILVQLLLHAGQFDQAVRLLEFYQNDVFRPERLEEFARLAGEAFLMTPLPPGAPRVALNKVESSQVRPEPRVLIYCGALENARWSDELEHVARRLTTMIFNDNKLIRIIGQENTLKLLAFYARRKSALDALRVAASLVDHTLVQGSGAASLIVRMWPMVTWDREVAEAGLELLRRYLRGVPLEQVPALIPYFEKEMGPHIGDVLRATFLMRMVMGEAGLMRFADEISTATHLLLDIAITYEAKKEPPPIHRLRRDLDTLTGGLSEQDRSQVAENTYNLLHQIYELGGDRSDKGKRQLQEQFIQEKAAPQTGVDLLRFVGGHFTDHQALALDLQREAMSHIFGTRSAAMVLRETDELTYLLGSLQNAFKTPLRVTPQALSAELESLWETLSLYHQQRVQTDIAENCQFLAELLSVLSDQTSDRILSNSGPGRQLETGQRQPHTALEAMRWINGYFARKHTRS
jgi:hypothetical protein